MMRTADEPFREPDEIDLAHESDFALGPLRVSPAAREVQFANRTEILEPRVMQALVCLAKADNAVVSRDDLIRQCWGGRIVGEDAINRCIGKVRQVAKLTAEPAFAVETIARVGYRLKWPGPEPRGPEAAVDDTDEPSSATRYRIVALALIAAVIATGGTLLSGVVAWPPQTGALTAEASPPEVVVELFDVAGPDLPQTFAADLREDMLTTYLPGATYATLRSGEPAPNRGAYRLRGRIETMGEQVEVYARLEPPDGSRILWSTHYEIPLNRARSAAIGHQVAGNVNCLMRITEGPHAPGLASPAMATWADFCVENGRRSDIELDREIAALRSTVALAPNFFPAQAFLGNFLSVAAERAQPSARSALTEEGLAAAMRAQQLAPEQGEGYSVEAKLRQEVEPARAEALYLKALSLRQSKMRWEAQEYSHLLDRMGRIDDAAEQHHRVLAVQPNNSFEIAGIGWGDAVRGRYVSADQMFNRLERQILESKCSPLFRLYLAVWTRNWSAAQAIARGPTECVSPERVALVDALSSGDPARISRVGAQFETLANDPATLNRATVTALAMTGRDKAAVAALGRLIDQYGQLRTLPLAWEPSFAAARRTPEFEALAIRYGLVDYWRTSGHPPDFCRAPDPPDLCRRLSSR